MTLQTKVVIVGAGPTGLSMAAQLLRYHIDFIILEKNERTTPLSKAVVVQARTLEIFRELDLSEKAVQAGQITTAINLFYKGRRKTAVDLAGLGEGLSPFPFALSLEQSKTEQLLVDFLTAHQKNIHWRSTVTHFEQQQDHVTVYYSDHNGQTQQIEAAYLVGCDGAGSLTRHQMGIPFEGDTIPKIFYVADVQLQSPVINTHELFMFMIKKGFVLFFPMEGLRHYRIVGILPDATDNTSLDFAAIENTIKEQVQVPVSFEAVQWFSSYKVHSRKAGAFENGRCFIAGDSAHIHTPAGGQGMNTGIQDAYNLAWKLAYTLNGTVSKAVLQSYSTERGENAQHLLQSTDRLFDIMSGTNAFWNFIRLHVFTRVIRLLSKAAVVKKRIFPLLSQTGIAYPNSYLTVPGSIGKVKAGDRMPYFLLPGNRPIFDELTEPAFKIVFFGTEGQHHPDQTGYRFPVVTKTFATIPAALFGQVKNFYVLLRPDNHISYIGTDRSTCKAFLEKIRVVE